MSTTAQRRAITRAIADLLRDRPDHNTPPAARTGWLVQKAELLAAIECGPAASPAATVQPQPPRVLGLLPVSGGTPTRRGMSGDAAPGDHRKR